MLTIILISCLALTITGLPVENHEQRSSTKTNPELLGGGFEGDIILPPGFDPTRGAALSGEYYRWPNKVVPYDISAITNTNDRTTITNAMNALMYDIGTAIPGQQFARQVCVVFRPAEQTDTQFIKIQYGNGCSASVGYNTMYSKTVTLQQNGCFYSGIIQHELMHVLGFFHEQSRPDRDSYINVHFQNIDPSLTYNFEKYQWNVDVEVQGTSYDYGSIMHYPRDAFSVNGQPTITPIQAGATIGQREKLSPIDIAEIRAYYKC